MKRILICLLAALLLCGCNRQNENSLDFPKVTYAKKPMVTVPPKETPVPENLPSKMESLSVMDAGFNADVVASWGNRMLAADIDSRDYQLVWLKLADNRPIPLPIERKVIREDSTEQAEDESRIYDVVASDDAYFYVILGEMSRFTFSGAEVIENTEYSGRYRIEKYDRDGELVGNLSIELPVDTVREIEVLADGDLFILGGMQGLSTEINDAIIGLDVYITLDFESGEILSCLEREESHIYSISTSFDELFAFIYPGELKDSYFAIIDPVSGKETLLPIAIEYGMFNTPFCVQFADIMVGNGQYICEYLSDTRDVILRFNLAPDSTDVDINEILNQTGGQVTSACAIYEAVVIALYGHSELLVFSQM